MRNRPTPDGYVSRPAAATEATERALAELAGRADASVVILVEGVSNQIAVGTLARAQGRDLRASAEPWVRLCPCSCATPTGRTS